MRLLLVAEGVPNRDPRGGDGSSMITYHLLAGLPDDIEVELVTWDTGIEVPSEVTARCQAVTVLRQRGRRPSIAVAVFGSLSLGNAQRRTAKAVRMVAARSRQADVTLLHGPHTASFTADVTGPCVWQTVDPWPLRLGMQAEMARGVRRQYMRLRQRQLRRRERNLPQGVQLLTVGTRDSQIWGVQLDRPVRAVPNGVTGPAAGQQRSTTPTVVFAGSLDYAPNIDSAQRLVRDIAPLVWQTVPEARFVLAGRRAAPEVSALAGDRVEVRADVPSLPDELTQASVAVFPDRFGLGLRNTVREALAAGVPVVATDVASRELAPQPGLLVRSGDREIADEVVRLLQRPEVVIPPEDTAWETTVATYLQILGQAAGR